MSLNRSEQMLFDYIEGHPEEKRHWEASVRTRAARTTDPHEVARVLEADLWAYYCERSAVVSPFREIAAREGLPRISLRNLSELLLRLWAPPPAKRKASSAPRPGPYA